MSNKYLDIAMEKVIKQEINAVLDKIRAEIEQLTITEGGYDYTRKMAELYSLKIKVLQIIDKYKAESEPQPKIRHWQKRTDVSGNSWHTCPACGHIAHTLSRFCPDCGAKMEEQA